MLKIKDNVDLKELEKFGFRYFEDEGIRRYEWKERSKYGDLIFITIYVLPNRTISRNSNADYKLYDLIQAGLVEKIEEGY